MPTHTAKATQEAVVAYLKATAGISAIVSTRVYGPRAPQGATMPYICVSVASTPFDSKTRTGHEHFIRVQGFSSGITGKGPFSQASDMRAEVYAALHRGAFVVTGGVVVDCLQNGLDDVAFEPGNEVAQFTTEFRCIVQQTS